MLVSLGSGIRVVIFFKKLFIIYKYFLLYLNISFNYYFPLCVYITNRYTQLLLDYLIFTFNLCLNLLVTNLINLHLLI